MTGAIVCLLACCAMLAACSARPDSPASELLVDPALLPGKPVQRSVYFEPGSTKLNAQASRILAANARYLNLHKMRIRLAAHADDGQTPEATQQLAERRAWVVRRELQNIGVLAEHVTGMDIVALPLAAGEGSRHGDRRVDLVYLEQP